jgi:cytochrome c
MTKSLLLVILIAASSCGNQDTSSNEKKADSVTSSTAPAPDAAAPPAAAGVNKEKAIELIAKSDCLTCHKIEEKLVGPAYRDVANKYNADDQTITLLADKIIKGGKGVWGEVAMTPHAAIPVEDAKVMVQYILSLKQK